MNEKVIGYIVQAYSKWDQCHDDPLSYGTDDEPEPDMLSRRGRAHLFPSKEDAEAALKATYQRAKESGHTWIKDFQFRIIPVVE